MDDFDRPPFYTVRKFEDGRVVREDTRADVERAIALADAWASWSTRQCLIRVYEGLSLAVVYQTFGYDELCEPCSH